MKSLKNMMFASSLVLIVSAFGMIAHSVEPTVGEKIDETYQDAKKNVKKGYRKAKDEACEMVNGKMECAAKKMKHKAQNAADEIKDKADDVQKQTN